MKKSVYVLLVLPLVIAISTFSLFLLDHETQSVMHLFTPQNLAAFTLYFIPTLCICLLLFLHFSKNQTNLRSAVNALLIGVPVGFALIISILTFIL